MKLFTHNLLVCTKRNCGINSFPLKIKSTQVTKVTTELDADFLISLIESERLNWAGLVSGAHDIGLAMPAQLPADWKTNEQFLRALWDVVMDCQVMEGAMVCPVCGREYPIKEGIPNMVLSEQEF